MKLISMGVHIGDRMNAQHYSTAINYYLIGIRNSFLVIDLKKTIYYLKRALLYANVLSLKRGSFLFYHSDIDSFFNLKVIFFYLIKVKARQSYINYS